MANDVLNALLTRRSLKPKYLTLPFPTKDQSRQLPAPLCAPRCTATIFPAVSSLFRTSSGQISRTLSQCSRHAGRRSRKTGTRCQQSLQRSFAYRLRGERFCQRQYYGIPDFSRRSPGAIPFGSQSSRIRTITLSGSVLESPVLQAAFCKAPTEKLVAWITIGTPAEGVTFAPETGEAPLSVWY